MHARAFNLAHALKVFLERMNLSGMGSNPFFDPFVEAGYMGYSIRVTAHRQFNKTFRPSLKIRSCRAGSRAVLHEYMLQKLFPDADSAIHWAMGKGRQVSEILHACTFNMHLQN